MSGRPFRSILHVMTSTTNTNKTSNGKPSSEKTSSEKNPPIEVSLMGTIGRPFV